MHKWMKKLTSIMCTLCLAAIPAASMPANAAATVYGDVNNNGEVEIGDCILLNKYLTGQIPSSGINMKNADVDMNAVLDVNDAKVIMDSIVGLVPSLPYSESGNMINYNSYSVPPDQARSYIKYDCVTGQQTTYSLSKASEVSTAAVVDDDRILDSSANAQCIVYLHIRDGSVNGARGTGFIVDDHIIATAAHCLYDGTKFMGKTTVSIYNAEGTTPIKTCSATQLHIPSSYLTASVPKNYDYGLIYVEEDLSAYGKMSLGIMTNNFVCTNQAVNVSGFPGEVNDVPTTGRYYATGNIKPSNGNYTFDYTTMTSSGDSGGPVYIEYTLKGEIFRSAIGIHTYGNGQSSHSGTRITLPLLRFYYSNPNVG